MAAHSTQWGSWTSTAPTTAPSSYTSYLPPGTQQSKSFISSDASGPGSIPGLHPIAQFFGPDNTGRWPTEYDQPREHMTLPEAYKRGDGNNVYLSQILLNQVEKKMIWWITECLPWNINESGLQITWNSWIFNDHMLSRSPEETSPYLLTTQMAEGRSHMVRYGIALMMEHGFWLTERGKVQYRYSMQQIAYATVETLCHGAAVALIQRNMANSPFAPKVSRALDSRSDLDAVIEKMNDSWAIIQKTQNGLRSLFAMAERDFISQNRVPGDYVILPQGSRMYLDLTPMAKYIFLTSIERAKDKKEVFGGTVVRESRPFTMGIGSLPHDPFYRQRTIGEYFTMRGEFVRNIPAKDYRSHKMNMTIHCEDRDDWVSLQYNDILFHNCGLFHHTRVGGIPPPPPTVPSLDDSSPSEIKGERYPLTEMGIMFFAGSKYWDDYLESQGLLNRVADAIKNAIDDVHFQEYLTKFILPITSPSGSVGSPSGSGAPTTTSGGPSGGGEGKAPVKTSTSAVITKTSLLDYIDRTSSEGYTSGQVMAAKSLVHATDSNRHLIIYYLVNRSLSPAEIVTHSASRLTSMSTSLSSSSSTNVVIQLDKTNQVTYTGDGARAIIALRHIYTFPVIAPGQTEDEKAMVGVIIAPTGPTTNSDAYFWVWRTYIQPTVRGKAWNELGTAGISASTMKVAINKITNDNITVPSEYKTLIETAMRTPSTSNLFRVEEKREETRMMSELETKNGRDTFSVLQGFDDMLDTEEYNSLVEFSVLIRELQKEGTRALYRKKCLSTPPTPWSKQAFMWNIIMLDQALLHYNKSGTRGVDLSDTARDLLYYCYDTDADPSSALRSHTETKISTFKSSLTPDVLQKLLNLAKGHSERIDASRRTELGTAGSMTKRDAWSESNIRSSLGLLKISGDFIEWALRANVPPIIDVLIFRPHMTYTMGTMVYMLAYGKSGYTYYGHANMQLSDEVKRKTIFGHWTLYARSITTQPQLIHHVNDVICRAYNGGGGTIFWNPLNKHDVEDYRRGIVGDKSLFACAIHASSPPMHRYIDITGVYHNRMLNSDTMKQHYSTAEIYRTTWRWDHGPSILDENLTDDLLNPRYNTLVFEGHQNKWDEATRGYNCVVRNKSPWGPNVYPGCGKARRNGPYLQPVSEPKTTVVSFA
jgi:hypothetical protein